MKSQSKKLEPFANVTSNLIKNLFPFLNSTDGISIDSTIIIVSAILPGAAAFFYALAYLFFYGYYFGGNSSNSLSLITLFIYPIPFNFKSLTILGLFLAVITIVIAMILNNLIKSIKHAHLTSFIIDLVLLFIIIVISSICIDIFFAGKIGGTEWIKVWEYPVLTFLIISLVYSKNTSNLMMGFGSGFVIAIFIVIIQIVFNIGNKQINVQLFCVTGLLISYTLCFGEFKKVKKIIIGIIILMTLIFTREKLFILSYINSKLLKLIVGVGMSLIILIAICKLLLQIEVVFNKVKKKKFLDKALRKIKKFFGSVYKNVLERYSKLIVTALLTLYIVIMSFSIFSLGVYSGQAIQIKSFNTIEFLGEDNNKSDPIKGNIAAFKDDVYYISDKNKNLIIIKADKIIVKDMK